MIAPSSCVVVPPVISRPRGASWHARAGGNDAGVREALAGPGGVPADVERWPAAGGVTAGAPVVAGVAAVLTGVADGASRGLGRAVWTHSQGRGPLVVGEDALGEAAGCACPAADAGPGVDGPGVDGGAEIPGGASVGPSGVPGPPVPPAEGGRRKPSLMPAGRTARGPRRVLRRSPGR